jgi:hypothetical protein
VLSSHFMLTFQKFYLGNRERQLVNATDEWMVFMGASAVGS